MSPTPCKQRFDTPPSVPDMPDSPPPINFLDLPPGLPLSRFLGVPEGGHSITPAQVSRLCFSPYITLHAILAPSSFPTDI
ncbi:Uncharacterized protein HZ326_20231 [Fusarium oxysporum f. sp. albedinis]|nr:Uncharacterized protein HZ326_20231 [Fusarium oxysporum f. sp. albedinis]